MSLYTITITLILVMDPLGNIPIFLSILRKYDAKKQMQIMLRESFIAIAVLFAFLFFGSYILKGFNITTAALSVSGGLVLFIIALKMIFSTEDFDGPDRSEEPFIVPIAIPLIAGPSSLAMVMLFASRQPDQLAELSLAVAIASVVLIATIMCSRIFMKLLGPRALAAIARLMGMILTTVAVQMFLDGIMEYIH